MSPLPPDRTHHGRVAALEPPGRPRRVSVTLGGRLAVLEGSPGLLGEFAIGDLVAFTVGGDGRLATVVRMGGPGRDPGYDPGRDSGRGLHPNGDANRWLQGAQPGEAGPSRHDLLKLRHRLLRAVRDWFAERGFIETDTPVLARAPSPEAVFSPFATQGAWLISSPEFQLKRMLVGGFERIYRLGPVFRAGEEGAHHNPEFTLLEWYRAFMDAGGLEAMGADLEGLLGTLAPLADEAAGLWPPGPRREGLAALSRALRAAPWRRATVGGLFAEHLGLDLTGITTAAHLTATAQSAGVEGAESLPDDFTGAFSELWIRVEAALPPEPMLVTDWPAPTASLARLKPGDPALAERMELYAGGLELANGFAELTDPAEQRRRFDADLAQRRAKGLPAVPLDERFLSALAEGMPPSAGMALGFDRLAMLLFGAAHIRAVLPFAWDER